MDADLAALKQRLPLLQYLERRHWQYQRVGTQQEFVGLCPLHQETRPSFYVNARKNLFYCHGCGRGGDLIRFVELERQLSFPESIAQLQQEWCSAPAAELLEEQNESATLETITSMLIAREWTRMKAMKAAIQLVERAAGTWRSIEGYWLNRPYF